MPAVVLVLGVESAVVLSTTVGSAAALVTLSRLVSFTDGRVVTIAIAGSAVGLPCGACLLSVANADVLQGAMAVIVRLAAWTTRQPVAMPKHVSVYGIGVAGLVSGAARLAAGLPGPPIVLYMRTLGQPPLVQRATLSAFFAVSGLLGCAFLTIAGSMTSKTTALSVAALPMVAIGAWVGEKASATISEERFRVAVTWMLIVERSQCPGRIGGMTNFRNCPASRSRLS